MNAYGIIPFGKTSYEGFRNFLDGLLGEEVYYASDSSNRHVFI